MKSADITPGVDYAHRHTSYARATKVTVLETRVPYQGTKQGVRVRFENGGDATFPSRKIYKTWADYEAEREQAERERERKAEARRMVYTERARAARVLENALRNHGEPVHEVPVFRAEQRVALEAAGFRLFGGKVETRISGLADLMSRGSVDLGDLSPVLADLALEQRGVA